MSNTTTAGAVSAAAPRWSEQDEMAHIEDDLRTGEITTMAEEQNNRIHLSNAVTHLIPDSKCLHYMYEDNDLHGNREAEMHFEWLDKYAPGRFILVDTGDLIVPPCSREHDHYGCETYDADYHLYLVPVSVWDQCKDEVLKADREWRERMSQCQVQKVEAK